jgi:hypothetical protein
MSKTFCAFGAALVLAACASQPVTTAEADARAACRDADPPIGSHVVRRSDCGAQTTPEQREAARRQAEAMQRTHSTIMK